MKRLTVRGERQAGVSRRSLIATAVAVVTVLALSGSAAAKQSRLTIPSPTTKSYLNGDDCLSLTDCWAVGHYVNASNVNLDETVFWNGTKWTLVGAPSPGGTASGDVSQLFAVSCTSASNCWAAGYAQSSGGPGLNVILHWTGAAWSKVSSPDPGGTASGAVNYLDGIACVSASRCWAVGRAQRPGGPTVNEALLWNGIRWSAIAVPNPGGGGSGADNSLSGVFCSSPTDCWAVGWGSPDGVTYRNTTLHWTGTTWASVSAPNPGGTATGAFNGLSAVFCSSSSDCWAVGTDSISGSTYRNQALRWNGTKWAFVATPQPGGTATGDSNFLKSVLCTSTSDCWAVGSAQTGSGPQLNDALRWNGLSWAHVATPDPGGTASGDSNGLYGVSCAAAGSCWTVGQISRSGSDLNQALQWNGSAWLTG